MEFRSGGAFYLEDLVCRNGDLELPELSVVMVDDDGGRKKKEEIKDIKEATSLVSIVINTTPASVETIKTCGQTIWSIKVQMPTSLVSSSSTETKRNGESTAVGNGAVVCGGGETERNNSGEGVGMVGISVVGNGCENGGVFWVSGGLYCRRV
ncbi:hypothetical protein ACFE04_003457 [Oxalis oulophora]